MQKQDLEDLKNDVGRAFRAAIFSMDYCILRIILDTSKESTKAYEKRDYQSMIFCINKGFWDIGICINNKLNSYTSVSPEFFDNISSNIKNYLKTDNNLAFSPENLKRCLKLVNLANESWFESIAKNISWQYIADAIDQFNSFDELKNFLDNVAAKSIKQGKK